MRGLKKRWSTRSASKRATSTASGPCAAGPTAACASIADETGGGYFELKKTSDLAPTFTSVAQELHSQYVIGFTPTELDNRVHKLMVKMKRPGMTARARRSYVAAADKIRGGEK